MPIGNRVRYKIHASTSRWTGGGDDNNWQIADNSENGDSYIIIDADSVNGTFDGLDDNDTFSVFGRTLRINYTLTQVTLTDVT